MMPAGVVDRHYAADLVAEWRRAGLTVVFTNGVFDLLHRGHADYLAAARRLGDALIVGVNSDASTARIKGPARPLVVADDRAALLAALRSVDAVVIFEEDTAEALVGALRPDVYVKGSDYAAGGKPIPEAAIVQAYGGLVAFVPLLEGRSTSGLIQRIVERYGVPGA